MARPYEPPTPGQAPRLVAVTQSKSLEPHSVVTLVFRGGPPVVDKFDGVDYIVPPLPAGVALHEWRERTHSASQWQVEYQVAAHLQTRAIVPGSRNPHTGKVKSQLGIAEVDRPDRLTPFTPEELQQFGYPEAIDRGAAELPSMRHVQVISTTEAIAAANAAGQNIDEQLEAEPGPEITERPEYHEGLANAQADTADFEAGGGKASQTRPSRGGRR